jgi:gas vesicle protein GvpA/GvpJ/GvpM family
MTSPSRDLQPGQAGGRPVGRPADAYLSTHTQGQSLADVLERVLDKGIVIVGDIQVRLLDIELLTIKLRLLVASVDKAKEMGVNWWESDEFASAQNGGDNGDRAELASRVKALEERLTDDAEPTGRKKQSGSKAGRSSR